jgi:glycosyltransferase involved in cell wall biosynthesis
MTRRVDNPEPGWAVGAKYRLFDRVITISEAIRDVLEKQGVEPSLLRCVRSALDPEPFSRPCPDQGLPAEWNIGPDDPVVGMAAQFIARKGHDTLLDAVPRILEQIPEARFVLLGRGPLLDAVSRRVRREGLEDTVHLPGFREDLPDLLPCMDLLVHPATREGLGVILLQAGAAGLPVVAAAVGGIPEVVVDGETGRLIPPGDPEALARAVTELLSDPAGLQEMGASARVRVYREFSVAGMVEGNLKVYRELLGTSS